MLGSCLVVRGGTGMRLDSVLSGPCRASKPHFWSSAPCKCAAKNQHRARAVGATKGCTFRGVGSSIPKTVLSNEDLAKYIDTNDEWISTRTGIRRRHVLAQGETITSHSIASANAALEMAGLQGSDIDMVILATSSPDDLFGSACAV